jgi:hypothetical protein
MNPVVDASPSSLGFRAIAAFVACQSLLIPIETRIMALGGLAAYCERRNACESDSLGLDTSGWRSRHANAHDPNRMSD